MKYVIWMVLAVSFVGCATPVLPPDPVLDGHGSYPPPNATAYDSAKSNHDETRRGFFRGLGSALNAVTPPPRKETKCTSNIQGETSVNTTCYTDP